MKSSQSFSQKTIKFVETLPSGFILTDLFFESMIVEELTEVIPKVVPGIWWKITLARLSTALLNHRAFPFPKYFLWTKFSEIPQFYLVKN